MKRFFAAFYFTIVLSLSASAVEGMWIPSLIDMFYSDMQTYGLKLTKEQIYSTNNSSLKDAVIHFNGGCTAEIVSDQGLFLTNHHCGFDAIQKHSSLENDYLKDGFWAKTKADELSCPWLRVTFVREIRDVTEAVLEGVTPEMTIREAEVMVNINSEKLQKEAMSGNIKARIKPFNQGNQFFMLITEDYNDIRLVGTPPSAIGKYGGDTDNWVWPRHTGDFSVFRIYADSENKSSKYAEGNSPYKPAQYLSINVGSKNEGDFTMIYGFPGSTDQHYTSGKLKFIVDEERPARILMRQKALDVMKPAMNSNPLIKIQYASKQARIANAYKKWIGQIGGLKQLNAVQKKINFEEEYRARAGEQTAWKTNYYSIIDALNKLQIENQKYEMARSMFLEYFYVGCELIEYAHGFNDLAYNSQKLDADGKLKAELDIKRRRMPGFFKNYQVDIDRQVFAVTSPLYAEYVDEGLLPDGFATEWADMEADIFENSVFLDTAKCAALLKDWGKKSEKAFQNDPALLWARKIHETYQTKVYPYYLVFQRKEALLMKQYVAGLLEMFPDKKIWADANSTLRIAYGKIEGSAPHDGMAYTHYTTIDGIMAKHDPNNPDFVLTDRFIKLYEEGDFGDYLQDGKLWTCFTASNHTTGGNSGSPCIDANGNLIGINFDRSWESTMSDFMFDESRCRNIVVDIRYVLWVIDKYGDAKHLVDEMTLVR